MTIDILFIMLILVISINFGKKLIFSFCDRAGVGKLEVGNILNYSCIFPVYWVPLIARFG